MDTRTWKKLGEVRMNGAMGRSADVRAVSFSGGNGTGCPEYNPGKWVFSPDGKFLCAGVNGCSLLDWSTGKLVRQFGLSAGQ